MLKHAAMAQRGDESEGNCLTVAKTGSEVDRSDVSELRMGTQATGWNSLGFWAKGDLEHPARAEGFLELWRGVCEVLCLRF